MALPKFLLFFIFSTLFYTVIASTELSDSVVAGEVTGVVSEAEASDASLRVELDQLKSKISLLGSKMDERMQELTSKEKTIKELEMIIEEKSNSLTSLQSQIQLLEEKVSLNAEEQEAGAHARARELEEQMNKLGKEIEAQNKKKDALESRATVAERKIQDLKLKLENLHWTNDEQKSRIINTQRALEAAEEELVKAKLEASSILEQLIEVHEAWIPPWLAVHIDYFRSFLMSSWNKHGRPALDLTKEKALEKKCEFEKWLRPRFETFKSEWVPTIKEQWLAFVDDFGLHLQSLTNMAIDKYHVSKEAIGPYAVRLKEEWIPIIRERWSAFVNDFGLHLQSLTNMAIDKYHVSKEAIGPYVVRLKEEWIPIIRERWSAFVNDFGLHLQSLTNMAIDKYHATRRSVEPHVVRLQLVMHLYVQEVKKFVEPYVEQVSSLTKPQMDKTRAFLKPYTKNFLRGYKKFVRKVNVLHQQVQATILDILKGHEFTRPLATKELVWYAASALMALPIIFMFNMVSALFPEKRKKRVWISHSSHTRRRAKRAHSER